MQELPSPGTHTDNCGRVDKRCTFHPAPIKEDPGLCAEGSRALNIEVVDSVDQFDLLLRFRVWCRDSRDGCLPGLEMITARLVCVVRMSVLMCCHMSFKGMRPQTVCMN